MTFCQLKHSFVLFVLEIQQIWYTVVQAEIISGYILPHLSTNYYSLIITTLLIAIKYSVAHTKKLNTHFWQIERSDSFFSLDRCSKKWSRCTAELVNINTLN